MNLNNFLKYYHPENRGDNMDSELLWEMFRTTGKIEYYMKYKKALKEGK